MCIDFDGQNFAKQLTGELMDPNQWADVFKASGAKYVVFSSKVFQ
jgi:alpha-L-fucosidase